MKNERKNLKKNQIIAFAITLAIIVVVNIIGSFVYTRFDLTSEKRYTLSDTSKEILRNLDDYVYFRIYLEGEFPAGFKKLRKETKEMLDEFRAYSKFIDYDFINPSESNDPAERTETYKILYQSGLNPTELAIQSKDGAQQIVIWPGALVSYKNKEMPLDLLDTQVGKSSEAALNNSVQNLEYKFITLYLTGAMNYDEMVQGLEIAIHQFSKRQMTWFRGIEKRGVTIHWVDASKPREQQVRLIKEMLYE